MSFRYKLTIEYKGFGFVGWQKQTDHSNSIQENIEKAITNLTGENVDLAGSGRTDAGVNAFAQIAHFDLEKEQDAFKMRGGLNHYLKDVDISIIDCKEVNKDFHSRFDAKMRHYQYQIINRYPKLTFDRNLAWHINIDIDLDKMISASKFLLGKHDFSSFRDSECQAKTPIRTIEEITILKEEDLIKINFSAPSFLHHQVRNMVGTLVMVGLEKIKPEEVKTILEAKNRVKSGPNAPSCGLYFVGVTY